MPRDAMRKIGARPLLYSHSGDGSWQCPCGQEEKRRGSSCRGFGMNPLLELVAEFNEGGKQDNEFFFFDVMDGEVQYFDDVRHPRPFVERHKTPPQSQVQVKRLK